MGLMSSSLREHGAGIVVAAWMLDPAACAALTVGEPQVAVPALCDLGRLLLEHRLRRGSSDDQDVIAEASNEERITAGHRGEVTTPTDHSAGGCADERAQRSGAKRRALAC